MRPNPFSCQTAPRNPEIRATIDKKGRQAYRPVSFQGRDSLPHKHIQCHRKILIGPDSHDHQASGQARQRGTRLSSSVLRMVVSVSNEMNPEHLAMAVYPVGYTGRASVDEQPNAMFGGDGHVRRVETGWVVVRSLRDAGRYAPCGMVPLLQMDGPLYRGWDLEVFCSIWALLYKLQLVRLCGHSVRGANAEAL